MKRLADFRKQVIEGWTVQRIAAVLIVVGLVVFVVGIVNKHCVCAGWPNVGETLNDVISDFYANVSVDCLSIAFAILVIDRLNERRADQELKAQFIREMGSTDNGIALRAVKELRVRGWLKDGSLRGGNLSDANLQGADLSESDLQGADLSDANLQNALVNNANLKGAKLLCANLEHAQLRNTDLQETDLVGANLREADLAGADLREAEVGDANDRVFKLSVYPYIFSGQTTLRGAVLEKAKLQKAKGLTEHHLVVVNCLMGATMCNGDLYDGRYELPSDIRYAIVNERRDINKDQLMASYYYISLEDYLAGQEWAREHLARVRREAGLEPIEDALLTELLLHTPRPSNGVEPQPTDAPASPAPRRNGHKASMVTHRVRR
jgi:uncharacterized protein YjbI with pentapeptide repeats